MFTELETDATYREHATAIIKNNSPCLRLIVGASVDIFRIPQLFFELKGYLSLHRVLMKAGRHVRSLPLLRYRGRLQQDRSFRFLMIAQKPLHAKERGGNRMCYEIIRRSLVQLNFATHRTGLFQFYLLIVER